MCPDNKCTRCGAVEDFKHLLWECPEARRIWASYNTYLSDMNHIHRNECSVSSYENVLRVEKVRTLSIIKIRIVQSMIQIIRPTGWTVKNISRLALELKIIEIYNSVAKRKFEITKIRWNDIR